MTTYPVVTEATRETKLYNRNAATVLAATLQISYKQAYRLCLSYRRGAGLRIRWTELQSIIERHGYTVYKTKHKVSTKAPGVYIILLHGWLIGLVNGQKHCLPSPYPAKIVTVYTIEPEVEF